MDTFIKNIVFVCCIETSFIRNEDLHYTRGGEGRVSKAENLRSPREIQSIFNLLGRTGKIIIFII